MLDRFSAISLGHGFGCGVDGGRVYCWGANDLGQCNGRPDDPVDALAPVAVPLEE